MYNDFINFKTIDLVYIYVFYIILFIFSDNFTDLIFLNNIIFKTIMYNESEVSSIKPVNL